MFNRQQIKEKMNATNELRTTLIFDSMIKILSEEGMVNEYEMFKNLGKFATECWKDENKIYILNKKFKTIASIINKTTKEILPEIITKNNGIIKKFKTKKFINSDFLLHEIVNFSKLYEYEEFSFTEELNLIKLLISEFNFSESIFVKRIIGKLCSDVNLNKSSKLLHYPMKPISNMGVFTLTDKEYYTSQNKIIFRILGSLAPSELGYYTQYLAFKELDSDVFTSAFKRSFNFKKEPAIGNLLRMIEPEEKVGIIIKESDKGELIRKPIINTLKELSQIDKSLFKGFLIHNKIMAYTQTEIKKLIEAKQNRKIDSMSFSNSVATLCLSEHIMTAKPIRHTTG